jgi:nicotinamidase-related amidase
MSSAYERSHELVSRSECQLLIIDMQEKVLAPIPVREQLVANCGKLIDAAKLFSVPVVITEQYPKGLGSTVSELGGRLSDIAIPEKLRFSAVEALNWGMAAERSDDRFKVVVAGIEAHVCVLQTVLDLLICGYQVHVAADAIGSRGKLDWKLALKRMASSGAVVTTTEAILFEWCETAGTAEFKQLSKLVTGR